jgi:hypothetical protein
MISPHNHHSDSGWQDSPLEASERATTELLLAALAQPRLICEMTGEDAAVAAITARIRSRRRLRVPLSVLGIAAPSMPGARSMRLAAVTGCLLGATTGAAFAGVLPAAAQDAAKSAFAQVGVSVPAGHTVQPSDAPPAVTKGWTNSGIAKDPSTSGRDNAAAVSSQASGGHSQAGADHSSTGKGSSDHAQGTGSGGSSSTAGTHRQDPPTPPATGTGDSTSQSGDHAQTGGSSTTGSAHAHG